MAQDFTDSRPSWGSRVERRRYNRKDFRALKSTFSGASAPASPVAGMWWYATTTHILKLRNEANNAWLAVWDRANNKPVITNLSNEITSAMISSALKSPAANVEGLRTLGTGATDACAGNDERLTSGVPPDASVTQPKLAYTAGDNLIIANERTGGSVANAGQK